MSNKKQKMKHNQRNEQFIVPLKGPHHFAKQVLQVEDFLHQETFDGCFLPAGRVNALGCLSPDQDLMLEFCQE